MSWQNTLLCGWLRLVEKPYLAREKDMARLRRRFERTARLAFRNPRGARYARETLGGVPVQWATSGADLETARAQGVILYFHGGAYVFGSSTTHRKMLARLSQATGLAACLPDYRLAPEHPFPAAPEDALAVYRALLGRVPSQRIVLGGDSAGGGLALALLAEIRRLGLPLPAGTFALSPLTDLRFAGASLTANAEADPLLPRSRVQDAQDFYLAGADPDDPRASPLVAELAGAGPVWLCVSTTEILLDDTRRMTAHLRSQGVAVTEVIEESLPHVWPIFHGWLPEADRTLEAVARWIRSLSGASAGS